MKEFFPRVLGNEKTRGRIGASILEGRLPHAFLLVGPEGSGKTTLAREISAALNCQRYKSDGALPCGECSSCKRIYENNFPDVKTLSRPKDRATIGVDHIKDFREDMFLSSTESDYKIYIIDDGECMTAEAQNALLKVLEEPPERVIILILATAADKILTTIKSRAQHIALSRFSDSEIEEHLMRLSPDARDIKRESPERLRGIIVSSDGVLGTALKLSNKKLAAECEKERAQILSVVSAIALPSSYAEIRAAIRALPEKRPELMSALEKITSAIRDLIVIKESESARLIFFSSREEAEPIASAASLKRLLKLHDEIQSAHALCAKNANVSNLLASLAAGIKLL